MNILDNIELFSILSEQEKKSLSMFCQERSLQAWEILFNEWDDPSAMYIVQNWLLEAYKVKDGEKTVLGFLKPWELLGEMALFNTSNVRTASVKAVEMSNLIVILNFSIKELASKHPEILEKIQDIIKKRQKENKNTK